MPIFPIDKLDDSRLDDYRNLNQQNLTRFSGQFIVEGRILVERLLASDFQVKSIISTAKLFGNVESQVPRETIVYLLDKHLINKLIGFHFHRGMLACAIRSPRVTFPVVTTEEEQIMVICPRILDQINLGGVIRNCAAFGATSVVVGKQSADPFSRRVVRVSMGAALSIPIVEPQDLGAFLTQLRDAFQFDIVATVLDDTAEILMDAKRSQRTALLFGSEDQGLDQKCLDLSNRQVTLPMRWGTDSLNVSTSAGVFLYHFTRNAQRCAE